MDCASGACVLQLRNLIPNRSSLLAKIELIRIRSLVAHARINLPSKTRQDSLPLIFLHPLQKRRGKLIQLEGMQRKIEIMERNLDKRKKNEVFAIKTHRYLLT